MMMCTLPASAVNKSLFAENKKHALKVEVYETWLRRRPGLTDKENETIIADKFAISRSTVRRYVKEIRINGYMPVYKPPQGRSLFAWSPEALRLMKNIYLRANNEAGKCTMRNAYRIICIEAQKNGWKVGSEISAYKYLNEVHKLLKAYTKGGVRALDNIFYIARDLTVLNPFEVIVGDQHIFDFWVINDNGEKIRPQCYAWLDMRTRLPYGIAFEQGPYNFRTVARALRAGIMRFGRFKSTYNDNGRPEISGKINGLITALQTLGMKYTDEAELYKTQNGKYAIEDENGNVVEIAETCEAWHKKNRRIFAAVKNAKTKPIERFFSTLEQLLADRLLPGAVKNLNASAPEDEKTSARLEWQEKNGFLLTFNEFVEHTMQALEVYENRIHSALKISPREEMEKAVKQEGFKPDFIEPASAAYLFMEPVTRKVRNARITACGLIFKGPDLTPEMVKKNRNNLAGLDGLTVEVRIDPDNPEAGAFAIDPRDKQAILLMPEAKINPLDEAQVQTAIEQKRANIKAVTQAYNDMTSGISKNTILSISQDKHKTAKKTAAETCIYAEPAPDLTSEELAEGVRLLLQKEQQTAAPKVYTSQRDRYEAVIGAILDQSPITRADMEFKIEYEKTMPPEEKIYIEKKIELGIRKREEINKWN